MTHIYRNTLFFFIISFLIYITLQSIDNQMMLYFAAAFYFGIIQHLQELFIKNILITFLLSAIILISFVAIYFRINNKIYKFVIIVLLAYLLYIIDIVHLFLKYPYLSPFIRIQLLQQLHIILSVKLKSQSCNFHS